MPHILRDASGAIIGVLDRPSAGGTREVPADDPELIAFLERTADGQETVRGRLTRADLEFIRVLEDLIAALMEKGIIGISDLPREAQRKLLDRATLRGKIAAHLPIMSEDSEIIF